MFSQLHTLHFHILHFQRLRNSTGSLRQAETVQACVYILKKKLLKLIFTGDLMTTTTIPLTAPV